MNIQKTYNYSDLEITPSVLTDISSRSECNPRYGSTLPLFTAPMDSIVDMHNLDYWGTNSIIPIIPRNISYETRQKYLHTSDHWIALSLQEFKELFCSLDGPKISQKGCIFKICIDIANGHQKALLENVKIAKTLAKEYNYTLIIMTGNIANPETYLEYCKANIDYVRCGIGGGSGCLTSSNTNVHYGLASLIIECKEIKDNLDKYNAFQTKIIADGGIKGFKDAITALACGADYVMIGGLFASFLESASKVVNVDYSEDGSISFNGTTYTKEWLQDENNKRELIENNYLMKPFHGMASKEGKLAINSKAAYLDALEGKAFTQRVKYTMEQWTNNFEGYLRSAMSYTNCRTLEEFKSRVKFNLVSEGTRNRVNKE